MSPLCAFFSSAAFFSSSLGIASSSPATGSSDGTKRVGLSAILRVAMAFSAQSHNPVRTADHTRTKQADRNKQYYVFVSKWLNNDINAMKCS